MTYAKTRAIRLTDAQVAALEALAAELHITDEAEERLRPLLAQRGETGAGALSARVAALEVVAQAAMGVD